MPQESGDLTPKRQAEIKLFAAGAGVAAEWLSSFMGAGDVAQSSAGAAFTVATEAVLASRLSIRERRNVETVASGAAKRIIERCADGEPLREDSFVLGASSSFIELVDGALITAQRNYESKKLPYLSKLTASFLFETSVESTTANWCIRTADSLSWTQYVLLALVNEDESEYPRFPISAGPDRTVDDPTTLSVREDWDDLYVRRLIGVDRDRQGEGAVPPRMGYIPTQTGRLLIRLMELRTVTLADRDLIYAALLKGAAHPT